MLMRLMSKGEYLIVPKGTKFTGAGKLGLKKKKCYQHAKANSPISQYERPREVGLASSACVDKTTKIITEFTHKDPFLHLKRAKYCNRYYYEVNWYM